MMTVKAVDLRRRRRPLMLLARVQVLLLVLLLREPRRSMGFVILAPPPPPPPSFSSQSSSCLFFSQQQQQQRFSSRTRGSTTLVRLSLTSPPNTTPTNEEEDDDENEEENIFYDDFGGQVIGRIFDGGDGSDSGSVFEVLEEESSSSSSLTSSSSSSSSSSTSASSTSSSTTALNARLESLAQQERQTRELRLENWNRGNWQVRGLSLDPDAAAEADDNSDSDNKNNKRIHVCLVQADPVETNRIWIGRTDGSLLAVQLGDEFLTSFRSQLSAHYDASTGGATISATKLVNEEESDQVVSDFEDEEESERSRSRSNRVAPFELEYQGSAGSSALSCLLLLHNNESSSSSLAFTACEDSGDIQQWIVGDGDDDDDDGLALVRTRTLTGAHANSTIVMLKMASLPPVVVRRNKEPADTEQQQQPSDHVLVSVAQDGSLALWDLKKMTNTGDGDSAMPIVQSQIGGGGSTITVTTAPVCADCDGTNLFVGTGQGQVLAYAIADLFELSTAASSSRTKSLSQPVTPNGQWMASSSQEPITAIACAGPGTLGATSTTVLTGDRSGTIKQWEILSRTVPKQVTTSRGEDDDGGGSVKEGDDGAPTSTSSMAAKLEQWPKLSTQRLSKRAHLFQKSHSGAITALQPIQDGTKILSASSDGSVMCWNPATGKSYFSMEGFESNIRSLCLQENTLVTDGMKHLVCVHDFNIDPPSEDEEDDYDDWDRRDFRGPR